MNIIFSTFFVYLFLVVCISIFRWRALNSTRDALIDNNHQKAVSLTWAWASDDMIRQLHQRWGSNRFGSILIEPRPNVARIFYPHIAVCFAAVMVYQKFFRFGGPLEPGDCPNTPNCSNYLLGCLIRFSFFNALAKGYTRYQSCSSHKPLSFDERF